MNNDPSEFSDPTATDNPSGRPHGRFVGEVMGGGAVVERADDELVGGWRGALGVLAAAALIAQLGVFSIWWLVFVVGVLVAIALHELGHFVTARATGMKATQFFIGFGPRVWSFRRGETEYGLRLLPLGAFVRIIGMNNMDTDVDPADEQRTYRVKSYPRRMLVISAGSIMHMILAVILLFVVYVARGEQVIRDGAEVPPNVQVVGGALAAGIEPGDVVLAIDGQPIDRWSRLGEIVRSRAVGDQVSVELLRNGASKTVTATLGASFPAEATIVSVEGHPLTDVLALGRLARQADDHFVGVEIVDPVTNEPNVVGGYLTMVDGDPHVSATPLLGVTTRDYRETIEHSVPAAAWNAVTDIVPTSWEMTKGAIKVLNPVSVFTHVSGSNTDIATRPTTLVGVTSLSDDVGESDGLIGILFLLAILNVFVGVFNMFPLLPLDGGHAAVATYERIREGRRARNGERYYADVAKLMPFAMAVVVALGFLFLSGLYLDITKPL